MVVRISMDLFGAYVHIPFCIQRCHYCDFATYSKDQIQANDEYVDHVCREIRLRRPLFSERYLDTLYFGGGTPSLLTPEQLNQIVQAFRAEGLTIDPNTEVTIEVNPATLDAEKCEQFKEIGINRISIGCQSFNDQYLQACNREHTADQTRETIRLVKKHFDNFSLDLLFSLPQQELKQLAADLKEVVDFAPPHVSAYCLTLPSHHPMNQGRCSEDEQIEMFELVIAGLRSIGLERYELSNFSSPGFHSKHNNLYWTDQNYWGLGLSAHSFRKTADASYRFWNTKSYSAYMQQMDRLEEAKSIETSFASSQWERLGLHEAMTDFCHTHLRLAQGLNQQSVRHKFGDWAPKLVQDKLQDSQKKGLILPTPLGFRLTERGFLLSNLVFSDLLISPEDIDKAQTSPLF